MWGTGGWREERQDSKIPQFIISAIPYSSCRCLLPVAVGCWLTLMTSVVVDFVVVVVGFTASTVVVVGVTVSIVVVKEESVRTCNSQYKVA